MMFEQEFNQRFVESMDALWREAKQAFKDSVACTCLIGTSFSVTDPWCPEHRVVMDFSGFVSSDLAED